MNYTRYKEIEKKAIEDAIAVAESKRPAYTGANNDVLHNFKSSADAMGISAYQAWGVFAKKHMDSLLSYAKDQGITQAESIESRVHDLINYSILLLAIKEDLSE